MLWDVEVDSVTRHQLTLYSVSTYTKSNQTLFKLHLSFSLHASLFLLLILSFSSRVSDIFRTFVAPFTF